jgi:hypothetical protein
MTPSTHLYDALKVYLRQCENLWRDVRHIQSICWMMLGMIQSAKVHPSGFGVYVQSRAQKAQSKQRRFRRNLSNRRINLAGVHQQLIRQALRKWGPQRLYLSLDTTMLWNCFCVVWVGVVYRGRTVPIAFRVVPHKSSTIRLWYVQRVLRQVAATLPASVEVVLLADRGFADGKLRKYRQQTLKWHFRVRIKHRFQFQTGDGQWHQISAIKLAAGEADFTGPVQLGKTKPYGPVYLAFAHDQQSGEFWMIASDEPTNWPTFAEYRLRFQIEANFLDLKSSGLQMEACRIRNPVALTQLLWVVALTMRFLVLQGTAVVAQGQRQAVDPHWKRGMR